MRNPSNNSPELSAEKRGELLDFLRKEAHVKKTWINTQGKPVSDVIAALWCFNRDSDGNRPKNIQGLSSFKNALRIIYENLLIIKFMNTQNLEFLQSNLKYFGFGDKLNEALEKNISDQQKEFQLKLEIPHFNNKMDYTLHFKKSDSTDMYFFNRYDAAIQNDKSELNKNQTFYINKGNGVTAKEAYNLLEGRSVFRNLINRNGNPYSAWLKIDFENKDDKGNHKLKQFSEQYGYDLEKTLSNFPIKEMGSEEQKLMLISSLKKGNVQQVTMERDGSQSKYFIEAVPQYKNINVYDPKMNMVKRQTVQKENSIIEQSTGQKTAAKKEQKQDVDDSGPKKKQTRKKKLSV
ncbi:hypothetical protein [Albibacterium sp.]|uniref:hypothetical protein n=1 Tax=Albibacterium sp. TaxID=2952885 RepID=UPI002C699B76|nr:hypothetical protein [Albibacterium sp.]HUH19372.1 hypothetical protein [Albibacterium sp.]